MALLRCIACAITTLFLVTSAALARGPQAAESLKALAARIPAVAGNDRGIGRAEEALAKAIQAYGAAAIPVMLPLLRSDRANVRWFAGYVIRDLEGLTEEHLDALIAARRRGDGWIPPAIGRVGTPRAIQFLVDDLKAAPESPTR